MDGIPPDLLHRLRDFLLRCGPFESDQDLAVLFVDNRIYMWLHGVPVADTVRERVDRLITYLFDLYNSDGENALVLFLCVLRDHFCREDKCYQQAIELSVELMAWAVSTAFSPRALPLSYSFFNPEIQHFSSNIVWSHQGKQTMDSIQDLAVELTRIVGLLQSLAFRYVREIDFFLKQVIPIIEEKLPNSTKSLNRLLENPASVIVDTVEEAHIVIYDLEKALVKADAESEQKLVDYCHQLSELRQFLSGSLRKGPPDYILTSRTSSRSHNAPSGADVPGVDDDAAGGI